MKEASRKEDCALGSAKLGKVPIGAPLCPLSNTGAQKSDLDVAEGAGEFGYLNIASGDDMTCLACHAATQLTTGNNQPEVFWAALSSFPSRLQVHGNGPLEGS